MAQGSDLQTVSVEGTSKAEMPGVASREITSAAIERVAREQAMDALGKERYTQNKVLVEKQIVKQATRFIPFANAAEPTKQPDGSWKASVEVKVSRSSLMRMLTDSGLGGRGVVTSANVLPLIAITDRTKTATYRWWMAETLTPEQKSLAPLANYLNQQMATEFEKQKIAFVAPPQSTANLPDIVKTDKPQAAEYTAIGGFFKTSMLAKGDVRIMTNKDVSGSALVTIKIQVIESASPDRIVAEITREFGTDPLAASIDAGVRAKAPQEFAALAKDLASQVQVAWQRGVVGTNYMRLAVRSQMNPVQQAEFKAALQRTIREIKDVKERVFDRGMVTYEIDYAGDAQAFSTRFKGVQMPGFDVRLAQVEGAGTTVMLDVRAVQH